MALSRSMAGVGFGCSRYGCAPQPEELIRKRHAIFRHLSQKDIVPFPGEDAREFWQRAEERTQGTAALFNKIGMPEYQAIELFAKLL